MAQQKQMTFDDECKHWVYRWCCEYCQEGMELGRGTLLDSSGLRGKGHFWESCQSSAVLAPWLHLGRNNPANKNLDKNTNQFGYLLLTGLISIRVCASLLTG